MPTVAGELRFPGMELVAMVLWVFPVTAGSSAANLTYQEQSRLWGSATGSFAPQMQVLWRLAGLFPASTA